MDASSLCVFGFVLLSSAQPVLPSGFLHVGFGLYQLLPPGTTSEQNQPTTDEPAVTPVHHDVAGMWELRSSLSGGLPPPTSGNITFLGDPKVKYPWMHETLCINSSTELPRFRFLLCLDPFDATPSARPCQLGRLETEALPIMSATPFGTDTIQLNDMLVLGMTQTGDVSRNPAVFGFNEWPGGVRLRIYVTCCGTRSDPAELCEEVLTFTARAAPLPGVPSRPVQPRALSLTGKGKLMISVLAQCDPDFYGPDCSKQCRVAFPHVEHAFCNVTTGERQCMPGWEGEECQIDKDECSLNYCHTGSTCVNTPPGSFTCYCPAGAVGRLCEFRAPVCHTQPCLNGGLCSDTNFGFICTCAANFTGVRCETTLPTTEFTDFDPFLLDLNDTFADIGSTGSVSDDLQTQSDKWQEWHIALFVCAAILFICITALGCLLIRGRIKGYRFSKGRSFYSICIKPSNTFDNVMYDQDDVNSDIIAASNGNNGDRRTHVRQNSYTSYLDRYPRRNVQEEVDYHPDIVHVHRVSRREGSVKDNGSPRLLSAVPSVRRRDDAEREEMGHGYLDLTNPYCMSNLNECDGLPDLTQNHTLRMIRASHRSTVRDSPSSTGRSPGLGRHLAVPNLVITQHGISPRSIKRGHAEVYAISGALTPEDFASTSTPRPKPRRSFINALTARKNLPSEPRLRSVRRVDSCGYEVPRINPRGVIENEYTSLGKRVPEEHVYDEVQRYMSDFDSDSESLRELGVCTAVPPPRAMNAREKKLARGGKSPKATPRGARKPTPALEKEKTKTTHHETETNKAPAESRETKEDEEKDTKKNKKPKKEIHSNREFDIVSMSPDGVPTSSGKGQGQQGLRKGLPTDDGESSYRSDSGRGKSDVAYEELSELSSDAGDEIWNNPGNTDDAVFWNSANV